MSGPDDAGVDNLAQLLLDHPLDGAQPLLSTMTSSVTGDEVRRRAGALATELREAGIGPGEAVAVQLPNGPDFVIAMMGVWLARAVFVPVNDRLPPTGRDQLLEAAGAAALLDEEGLRRLGGGRAYGPEVAFVTWTSGTTGPPKPILHTHRSYVELLDRVLGPLRGGGQGDARPVSPNLIPVSLALNAGIYNVLFGLRAGAPIVIMEQFATADFAELVARFGIRSTVLPPAAITMLNDDPALPGLAPLRYVRSITAPLSPFQARRFTERFGAFVLNSYGQAEIGEVIGWTAADAKEHPEKLGAAGRPHPGVDVKIAGDDGPVPEGEVGQLFVRPPSMAAGYADGGELTDRIDDEGFVATGDLARLDAEGFVWLEGRLGDLINRGGNKVVPDEVEEVLAASPTVAEAAVVGVPDERLGEVPVAFVVCRGPLDAEGLGALCREHLAPYKVPVDFVAVPRLPRTDVGKILRRELADGYRPPA
ncbi:MAG TPA: class I adenylate-forming enzyme family protein [Acidimicrobiales bacterium]|nr:class I adenylate-forming enzyme family protein [Acidimicrobiales bacterium]